MDDKLWAFLCALCFGLAPVLVKMGFARNGRVDSAVIVALAVAIPVNALVLPFQGGLQWDRMTPAAAAWFAVGGLFGAGIGRRWMYIAIQRIGASPATAIKNAAPLFSTALAIVLFGEAVTVFHWLATFAIVVGIALVTWRPGERYNLLDAGLLAALGAALSFGIRPIIVKVGLEEAAIPVTASLIGAMAGLLYAIVASRPWRASRSRLDVVAHLREPATIMFVASGALQALAIVFINVALSGSDVSLVYPITSSAPLLTVILGWIFLRKSEPVSLRMLVGAGGVVAGVILL